jgi:glutathione S-transferase
MIRISAFPWVPPFAQGLVRDLRARWALEEAGLPYEVRLLSRADQKSQNYRALQPFGQVPVLEDGDLKLFESGAIVMHIAERSDALLPSDVDARARAKTWMFAALNSIEPHIQSLAEIDLFHADKEWTRERRPMVVEMVRKRLGELSAWLKGRDYLEDRFTAGDLLMTTVLRILRHTDLLAEQPALAAYRARCEARPAFAKALAAQMEPFARNAPANAPA